MDLDSLEPATESSQEDEEVGSDVLRKSGRGRPACGTIRTETWSH